MSGPDQEKRPGVGVGVIVRRDDEILLVRRTRHGAGKWSAPGGYLDHGEALEECAARETREETGLTIANIRFLAVGNDRFPDGKHNVTVWFEADATGGEARIAAPEELDDVRWFRQDQLPDELYESTRRLLRGDTLPADAFAGFGGEGRSRLAG